MIKKFIRFGFKIIISQVIFIFIISIFLQLRVELYKKKLEDVYGFSYLLKERKKYTPFILFFYQSKKNKENKCYWKNIKKPYEEFERDNHIKRNLGDTFVWVFNIEFNAYLMYCFYDLSELNCK